MKPANDGLRFLLELSVLASLGYWGFANFSGALRWVIGLGAPVSAAFVWGVFLSPKGSRRANDPVRLPLELVIFGAGVAALAAARSTPLALAFGAVVAVHLGLTFVLDQR